MHAEGEFVTIDPRFQFAVRGIAILLVHLLQEIESSAMPNNSKRIFSVLLSLCERIDRPFLRSRLMYRLKILSRSERSTLKILVWIMIILNA